jgi:uncharacterized protein (TIGR02569 family)
VRAEVAAPGARVLSAFGVDGPAEPLPGGQGTTWRAGPAVLKPAAFPDEVAWRANVLSRLPSLDRVRIARPRAARAGAWTVDGWEASEWVSGRPDPTRVADVLDAGDAFHAAVASAGHPPFLEQRDDPWAYGDRVAWGRAPVGRGGPWGDLLHRLDQRLLPVDLPVQPVHGDLLGNVLFADGLPPAVIDWAVYERPVLWSSAVVVVDAITWHQADPALVLRYADRPGWAQLLARALIFRIATNVGRELTGLPVSERPESYERVVDLVVTTTG